MALLFEDADGCCWSTSRVPIYLSDLDDLEFHKVPEEKAKSDQKSEPAIPSVDHFPHRETHQWGVYLGGGHGHNGWVFHRTRDDAYAFAQYWDETYGVNAAKRLATASDSRAADRIDGYDRDDGGLSPDY
jgi:hypothetical protein